MAVMILAVTDIAGQNETEPRLKQVGFFPSQLSEPVKAIAIDGSKLWFSTRSRLICYSVETPSNPQQLVSIPMPDIDKIKFRDEYLAVSGGGYVRVFDVSDMPDLKLIREIPAHVLDMAISQNNLFLSDVSGRKLKVFDLSEAITPSMPRQVLPKLALRLDVIMGFLVTTTDSQIEIFKISEGGRMEFHKSYNLSGEQLYHVSCNGSQCAIVGAVKGDMHVVNVSEDGSLEMSIFQLPVNIRSARAINLVSQGMLHITLPNKQFIINFKSAKISVTSTFDRFRQLELQEARDPMNEFQDTVIGGDLAFSRSEGQGVEIFDANTSSQRGPIGQVNPNYHVLRVDKAGDILYAFGPNTFYMLDVNKLPAIVPSGFRNSIVGANGERISGVVASNQRFTIFEDSKGEKHVLDNMLPEPELVFQSNPLIRDAELMVLSSSHLFVVSKTMSNITVLPISDSPQFNLVPAGEIQSENPILELYFSHEKLVIISEVQVEIWDVDDTADPVSERRIPINSLQFLNSDGWIIDSSGAGFRFIQDILKESTWQDMHSERGFDPRYQFIAGSNRVSVKSGQPYHLELNEILPNAAPQKLNALPVHAKLSPRYLRNAISIDESRFAIPAGRFGILIMEISDSPVPPDNKLGDHRLSDHPYLHSGGGRLAQLSITRSPSEIPDSQLIEFEVDNHEVREIALDSHHYFWSWDKRAMALQVHRATQMPGDHPFTIPFGRADFIDARIKNEKLNVRFSGNSLAVISLPPLRQKPDYFIESQHDSGVSLTHSNGGHSLQSIQAPAYHVDVPQHGFFLVASNSQYFDGTYPIGDNYIELFTVDESINLQPRLKLPVYGIVSDSLIVEDFLYLAMGPAGIGVVRLNDSESQPHVSHFSEVDSYDLASDRKYILSFAGHSISIFPNLVSPGNATWYRKLNQVGFRWDGVGVESTSSLTSGSWEKLVDPPNPIILDPAGGGSHKFFRVLTE